jgi:hypothetical protein
VLTGFVVSILLIPNPGGLLRSPAW